MTSRQGCSPAYRKKRKRERKRTALKVVSAIKVTHRLIRQFSKMVLTDTDSSFLPAKRRKLSDGSRDGNWEAGLFTDNPVTVSLPEPDCRDGTRNPDVMLIEFPLCETDPLRKFLRRDIDIDSFKSKVLKSRRVWDKCVNKLYKQEVSFQDVLDLFENCVLFRRHRGRPPCTENIDSDVRRFCDFGTVKSIRNHWVQRKGCPKEHPSVWAGASVSYSTQEDLDRACKAMSLRKMSMIAVALVDHLTRIHSMELLWESKFEDSGTRGTTVVVEGSFRQMFRSKLMTYLEKYGTILGVKWTEKTEPKCCSCEVVYKSTWSAVAAALALDGKTQLLKCGLKTRIKITSKELYIHRYLCETF